MGDLPKLKLAQRSSPLPPCPPAPEPVAVPLPTEAGVTVGGNGVNGVWGERLEVDAVDGEGYASLCVVPAGEEGEIGIGADISSTSVWE